MEICEYDSDCSCPVSKCISLEPDSIGDYFGFPWETPYHGILPNGAEYKTYINKDPDLTEYFIKSIGEFKGVQRAVEVSF